MAKLSDKWGGLIAALPTTTFLILLWMYVEGASNEKIGNHIGFTLYFVLPTLPMFLALPFMPGSSSSGCLLMVVREGLIWSMLSKFLFWLIIVLICRFVLISDYSVRNK